MVLLFVIIAFIVFILTDLVIRTIIDNHKKKKEREEREAVLSESLNLDFTTESKSLKRAEVEKPKARILAVDDEAIILDSFRKILVLDGYSVDTVETGQEALGMIQKHSYDFVFTDLKMPSMSGEDVCKSVKHLRPDIDVIIITGYASVESAVETMKYGAMDYIEKPFTEEELTDMVNKFVIKRKDKIEKTLKPKVHITHLSGAEKSSPFEFLIPGGVFISPSHCWAAISQDGTVKVGMDDFANKVIGKVDGIEAPNIGAAIGQDQHLFTIKQGDKKVNFPAPISGSVSKINNELLNDLTLLETTPYEKCWICALEADHLDNDLKGLKIGSAAVSFYQEEIEKYHDLIKKLSPELIDDEGEEKRLFSGDFEKLEKTHCEEISEIFFDR